MNKIMSQKRAFCKAAVLLVGVLMALFTMAAPVSAEDSTGRPASLTYGGHVYEFFPPGTSETFEEAREYCESIGGHLATITSKGEDEAVYQFLRSTGYEDALFGLYDDGTNAHWEWVTGEPVSYTNWAEDEPNNEDEMYGMYLSDHQDGKWNDGAWWWEDWGFLCEWDSESSYNDAFTLDNYSVIPRFWIGEYDGWQDPYGKVRRNIKMAITSIDSFGKIEGVVIVSPSDQSPSAYGIHGMYFFKGNINLRNAVISLMGDEWIAEPEAGGISWEFTLLAGKVDPDAGKINGSSDDGIWVMDRISNDEFHRTPLGYIELDDGQEYEYTGSGIKPSIKVFGMDGKTLREGVDYTVAYKNNVNPGKATVKVTGTGDYYSSLTGGFLIVEDLDDPHSSFIYKMFSTESLYRRHLSKKLGRIYTGIRNGIVSDAEFPIPGLAITYTVSGKATNTFVPQGICQAGNYILITAYDEKGEEKAKYNDNSVIYVVDQDGTRLLTTITLPHKYHVGGIAFDGSKVWLTGNTSDKYLKENKGTPFVQYFSYDVLQNMAVKNLSELSPDQMSNRIYIDNKPSFLECTDGKLWVGTYIDNVGTNKGYVYGYPILNKEGQGRLNTDVYDVITGIPSSAQGMDIVGNDLYVSSSYAGTNKSIKSSFIRKYDISAALNGNVCLNLSGKGKAVEVPKMNEEILVKDSKIFIVFESASEEWKNAAVNTDRVLPLNISLW